MRARKSSPEADPEGRVRIQPDIFQGYVLQVDSHSLYIPASLVDTFFATVEKWRLARSDAAKEVNDE